MPKGGIIGLLTALGLTAQFASGQLEPECNPLHASCQPNKAWAKDDYYIDFTKQTGRPSDWTIGNSEAVKFTSNGAEFSYAKKGDAPNMWTDFYMLGGRYDIEMKISSGQGVISSATLWSDTQDEIDYDFSGNQFGRTPFPPKDGMWAVETNIFAQGKMWDGAATHQKDSYKPAEQFHKYSVEWDESHIHWYVDDKIVRQVHAKNTPAGFTFPQSPMKLNLGIWGAGEPGNDRRTIQWAGGEINTKGAPYTLYVKSVNITNKYPACQYKYQDNTGKISSIEKVTDGCGLPNAELRRRDYSMSPPASAASEAESSTAITPSSLSTGYPTSEGFPTYPASDLTSSRSYSSYSLAQSSEASPASPLASSHSSASTPAEYPTYQASSPSAKPSSSSEGYPTSKAESSSSSHLSVSSVGYPTPNTGSSSAAVHSSASSVVESPASYPAAGASSSSHLSTFVGSASSTDKGVSSSASGSVKDSETSSSGYPVISPSSSVRPVSSSSRDEYSMSSPTSSNSGILSSLSSFILGTSSSASTAASSSEAKSTYPTASLTASGSIPVSSAGTAAVSSSGSSNSQGSNSGYPTSSPSATHSSASSSATESTNDYSRSSSSATNVPSDITSTVYSTNIYTVTSCAPTVTNCPVGKVTTELVSLSTTISSATAAESKPATSSAANSVSTTIQSAKSSSASSEVGSTVKTGASSQSYSASAQTSSSLTMPSTYSVSSEVTTSIMSTVYSTNVVTITSCAPSVTNCPVGKVTTETKSLYTTICPVTQTVLDGTTYGGTETAKEAPSTGGFTYSMSSYRPTSVESSASPSSSIISHSSGLVNSASASSSILSSSSVQPVATSGSSVGKISSASGSSSSYLMSSPVNSAGASFSILSSSVVVQNATASTPGSLPVSSSLSYSASGAVSSSSALPVATETSAPTQSISSYATQRNITASSRALTTSTVYTSSIYTVSSCKPGEAECSSNIGSVTTETVPLYTTICPVEETQKAKAEGTTSSQTLSASPGKSSATQDVSSYGMSSASSYSIESSASQVASSHATPAQSYAASTPSYAASASSYAASTPSYTTSTVYSTNIYTVTSCAPGVTNCPTKGSVTTEVVAVSTTVCPVADNSKGIPGSSVPTASASQYTSAAITFSNTLSGSVIVVTSTISFVDTPKPTSYYPTQGAGTTTSAGTAAVESSAHVTKPGTTISLGTYFTSFIEYDTITRQPPASVSSGAVPTSYYTGSSATVDVPSYQMSPESSIVGASPSSVPVAASAASSYPAAPPSPAVPKKVPEGSSYPVSPDSDETTTLTSSLTNTHTVTQSRSGKQFSTCACDQPTVYMTVTETAAKVTVTSTVQPASPSSYPTGTGTAPASEGTEEASTYPTSKPAGIRRWLGRGRGHGEHRN